MALRTTQFRSQGSSSLIALAAVVWLCGLRVPAHASASLFWNTGSVCTTFSTCVNAGSFGSLVGLRNAVGYQTETVNYAETGTSSTSGTDINGELGVGAGSKIVFNTGSQSRTWDGPIDFADSMTGVAGPCTGTTGCGVPSGNTLTRSTKNITVTGGTAYNPTKVQAAMTEMRDISAYWAAQAGAAVTSFGSGRNSFSGSGTNVYDIASNSLINTTGAISITGDETSLFIFNIRSSSSNSTIPVQLKHNITLTGLRPDQVFFNILGMSTGSATYQMSISGGSQSGIFYVAADNYNVNTIVNGRLFGGMGTSNWGANFVLNSPSDIPGRIPEPSTYVLLSAGLGALVWAKKRRTGRLL